MNFIDNFLDLHMMRIAFLIKKNDNNIFDY